MPTTGVDKACGHRRTTDYYSEGGALLGGDCLGCQRRYGMGICSGCDTEKRLWVVVDGHEVKRYCSEDCLQQARNRRNKSTARTVGGKARGRK